MEKKQHKILERRDLTESTYVLRFERHNLDFRAGQYIHVGPSSCMDRREYSIYSPPSEDFLEILVKEIPEGRVSPMLRKLETGETVEVEGPFGFFVLEPAAAELPHLFVATGTGISPFHSFVLDNPELNYTLLHGVRNTSELYEQEIFHPERRISCLSREKGQGYEGRVTDWLRENPQTENCMVYLCGSCDMIYDVYDILGSQDVGSDRIHAEVYF